LIVSRYGPDPAQVGELYRPVAAPRAGTVVIVHGGFWRARYDLSLGRPLARDLAGRGHTVWNVEYRRVGAGGGWPNTFADVAAAIDHLDTLDVDTSAVVAVGHSAGGHLATWAAGRGGLPDAAPGGTPAVRLTGVVSQAGVLDLAGGAGAHVGGRAILDLLGALPADAPQRYALADPLQNVPLDVPVVCLHSRRDAQVPFAQSEAYVAAARACGGEARLVETAGDHFTLIDPRHPDWAAARDAIAALLS